MWETLWPVAAKEATFSYSKISLWHSPRPISMFRETSVSSKTHLVKEMIPPPYSVLKKRISLLAQTKMSYAKHYWMLLLQEVPVSEERSGFRSDRIPCTIGYLSPVSLLSSLVWFAFFSDIFPRTTFGILLLGSSL